MPILLLFLQLKQPTNTYPPWNKQFAPENRPLEKEIPIGNHNFFGGKRGKLLVLGSVTFPQFSLF